MPSEVVVIVVFSLVLVVVVGGVAYATRKSVTRRWYAGTGLEDWRRTASDLTWRERWTLSRVNATGRAAPPRLAAAAVGRGEVMVACIEASTEPGSALRKLWRGLGLLFALLCVLSIVLVASGEREWHNWLQVVSQAWLAVVSLATPALQRRRLPMLRRSVTRNQALVGAQPTS